jgi:NADH-ubiquinone oxidoreductase chain 2
MSNAVASHQNIGVLYSRTNNILYLLVLISIYSLVDWYFLGKSIGIYNGLLYYNLTNILYIFFLLFITFFILLLTSFFPKNEIFKWPVLEIEMKVDNIEDNLNSHNTIKILNFFYMKDWNWSWKKYTSEIKMQKFIGDECELEQKRIYVNLNLLTKPFEHIFIQNERDHYTIIEYSLIVQFILIGSISLLSSNDLITIFLSIELQSYGLYILSTIYRNSESSTSAGLTYFLLGGLSSCIILLGQSFLYINTGTTNLDALYLIHVITTSDSDLFSYFMDLNLTLRDEINVNSFTLHIFNLSIYQYAIQFSLMVFAVGFLFKISAAPFHSWSPGVYDAIPTVTTTFVAIIPKISILILLFDIVYSTWYSTLDYSWTSILVLSSLLSLILGSVLGLSQFKLKRLYAYSTISHIGFILLALSIHNVESVQAFFFYIIQYSLSNLNAFLLLVIIGYTLVEMRTKEEVIASTKHEYKNYEKAIRNLSPVEYTDQLKGYFYSNPLIAISLSITLYSFIGVPPLVGFFAKQMVLSSALDNGYIFMSFVAILTSVISAVYYLYIIKHMFFEKSNMTKTKFIDIIPNLESYLKDKINTTSEKPDNSITDKAWKLNTTLKLSGWLTCIISILTLFILSFIFLYYEIYFLTTILSIIVIYKYD